MSETMDFFEHQDRARRRSVLLVICLVVAVVLITLSIYLVTAAAANTYVALIYLNEEEAKEEENARFWTENKPLRVGGDVPGATRWSAMAVSLLWHPWLFFGSIVGTVAVVACGSIYKTKKLREGGGDAIARLLGGHPVYPGTDDPSERVLHNVVEEMAIASGIATPPVFVMHEEKGINAFVSGHSADDAAIVVTMGCLTILDRAELQGVIAHEFSHILNGDMLLNLRVIGVLHGILMVSQCGRATLRMLSDRRALETLGGKKSGGVAMTAGIIYGISLIIVGAIGQFFGRLIKSALLRQREFLADASAVQFTRNPTGVVDAMKKIGGLVKGSRVENVHSPEVCHMFFGNALKPTFFNLFATHPPLTDRIQRIDDSFDGKFPMVPDPDRPVLRLKPRKRRRGDARKKKRMSTSAAMILAQVGALTASHLEYAWMLRDSLPEELVSAAREPQGAQAVIYGLLLSRNQRQREKQIDILKSRTDETILEHTMKLETAFLQIRTEQRMPLIDTVLPALRLMAEDQFQSFRDTVMSLVQADDQISLSEYMLVGVLVRHVASKYEGRKEPRAKGRLMGLLRKQCAILLSALARFGADDDIEATKAFKAASKRLPSKVREVALTPVETFGLVQIHAALKELRLISPKTKKRVMAACIVCIALDGTITVEEAELLRAVASSLGCPMPPLLPGQDLTPALEAAS